MWGFHRKLLCTLLAVGVGAVWGDVRIVQSSSTGLRLAFEADPGVQIEKALVAIPLQGEVALELVESLTRPVDDLVAEVVESEMPVRLGASGFLRDQRVVEVIFSTRGGDVIRDRIVVDLYFPHAPRGFGGGDRWGEDLYRHLLINFEQGRFWRRSPSRSSVAKSAVAEVRMWKVGVRESGMYRISGSDLVQTGIDLLDIDPGDIAMFYGGGRPLPDELDVDLEANLQEIAIVVEGGGDGRFDAGDAVLFYGEALSRWICDEAEQTYSYLRNPYAHDNVYWLTFEGEGSARRANQRDGAIRDVEVQKPEYFRRRLHEEAELAPLNIARGSIRSGREWYWQRVNVGDRPIFTHIVRFPGPGPLHFKMKLHGQSSADQVFGVLWNSRRLENLRLSDFGPHEFEIQADQPPVEGLNQLQFSHSVGSRWLLDWYELEFDHAFVAENGELQFSASLDSGAVEYRLEGFDDGAVRIFEIAGELAEIVSLNYDSEGGTVAFQDRADHPRREYLALAPSRWKRPQFIVEDEASRLKVSGNGADYLIITHGDFLSAAERLADWRASGGRSGAPMRTAVVDVEDIYDEFSGGLFDPTAIRNFLSHTANHWDPFPFFVVLLGDGSYDYKNNSGSSVGNWIPPYEDGESTYDEWFVEVIGQDLIADMALGRISVQTVAEADIVVDKIIAYGADPEPGNWQGRVLLVADDTVNADEPDRIEPYFLFDTEGVADTLLPSALDVDKLYLTDFPLEGRFKPRARDEFIRLFNKGSVLLTYVGHGNSNVFAHEHIFVLANDLEDIKNGRRLPFLYAAASQMGVFDDPLRDSIPEALLKWPGGGVIGMVAATRVGFHQSNMELARFFHDRMFRSRRDLLPVGQALMEAKALTVSNRENIRRYSLFGDPAQRLIIPPFKVELNSGDTLKALSEVHMSGQVVDASGNILTDFFGSASVQVFDSSSERRKVEQGEDLLYYQGGATLFRGRVPVEGGRFAAAFRVPKDITYRGRDGRISVYVWDGRRAGFGARGKLILAGTEAVPEVDEEGPEIHIGFVDREFNDGDFVSRQPVLRAILRDASGINITGEIGHRIEVRLDGEVIDVTEFFTSEDVYQEGVVVYPLPAVRPGEHKISLEAWDAYNNWAQQSVHFQVPQGGQILSEVFFHPNPTRGEGHFTFVLSEPAEKVKIQVFSVAGRLVDELEVDGQQGYNQLAWEWAEAPANGIYLYKISARGREGGRSETTAAIQVMR